MYRRISARLPPSARNRHALLLFLHLRAPTSSCWQRRSINRRTASCFDSRGAAWRALRRADSAARRRRTRKARHVVVLRQHARIAN